jgi:DNA-directed RNA polymerase specialized sigma24 family protein
MSGDTNPTSTQDSLLRAMLALQIADRDARLADAEPPRTELVLADQGFGLGEIASLTRRPYEAVKTTVRRARQVATKQKAPAKGAKSSG